MANRSSAFLQRALLLVLLGAEHRLSDPEKNKGVVKNLTVGANFCVLGYILHTFGPVNASYALIEISSKITGANVKKSWMQINDAPEKVYFIRVV